MKKERGKNMAKTTLTKNKEGYGYRYTELSEIHKYLEENGAWYYQYIDRIDGDDYIMTVKVINGEEKPALRGCRVVQATLSGIKNPAQEQGSALTYARRYSLLMAFGLATEDDDAQSLTEKKEWTVEEANNYELTFGKHKGKKLSEVPQNYLDWLLENDNTEIGLKEAIRTVFSSKGINILSDEEKSLKMDLMGKLGDIMLSKNVDREKLLKHYNVKSDSEMTIEQLEDAIEKLERGV